MTPDQSTPIEILTAMAERQEHFATPDLYYHLTESDRVMFRHAAKMLREAIRRIQAQEAKTVRRG